MKKYLFLLMLLLVTASVFAQDVIVKKDGTTILGKVIEIGTSEVKYKKFSNQDGPTYVINISDLLAINYQNGEKEEFSNTTSSEKSNEYMRNQFTSSNTAITNDNDSPATSTSSKLSTDDYCFYGLSYTADFEYAGEGIYGFSGQVFGPKGFGFGMSIGWNFKNSIAVAKICPNYFIPITENVFFYVPLYAALNYYTEGDEDQYKFGAELTPSIGLKFGKIVFSAGVAFGWTDGADKIGTGFNVKLAWAL
jgi:hypothetical protein